MRTDFALYFFCFSSTTINGNNNVTLLRRFFKSGIKEHLLEMFAMLSRFWLLRERGRV